MSETRRTSPVRLAAALPSMPNKTGSLVCLVAFGAGLTWGSAFLRY